MATYVDKENKVIDNPESQITDGSAKWDISNALEEKGSVYLCTCGLSKKKPFCDGSHKVQDGGFKPILMEKKDGTVLVKNMRETLLGDEDKLLENRYQNLLERVEKREAELDRLKIITKSMQMFSVGATLGIAVAAVFAVKFWKKRN